MSATRPFLQRVTEQAKRFADLPEVTTTIQSGELLEDVRTAHSQVYEDFSKAISPEARFWRTYWDAGALTENQRFLRVPASFRKFFKFRKWTEDRKTVLGQRSQVPGTDGRNGLILLPHMRRMEFFPLVQASEADLPDSAFWELTFESGPIELHYGAPVAHLTATSVTYVTATKTITKTGLFANYEFKSGDTIQVTGGTGAVEDSHLIASRVDDDSVTLVTAGGSGDASDFAISAWKIDRIGLDTTPTEGEFIGADHYYVGATIYVVSGTGIDQHAEVKAFAVSDGEAVFIDDLDLALDSTSIYEVKPWVPGPSGAFDEIIAWRMALKYRRTRPDDTGAERTAVREIQTIFDAALKQVSDVNTDKGISTRQLMIGRNRRIWPQLNW